MEARVLARIDGPQLHMAVLDNKTGFIGTVSGPLGR